MERLIVISDIASFKFLEHIALVTGNTQLVEVRGFFYPVYVDVSKVIIRESL